jgi:hypothetical protein
MFHLPKEQRKTAVVAGTVGNIIEWYDFALYGYFATVLATLFFPAENRAVSLDCYLWRLCRRLYYAADRSGGVWVARRHHRTQPHDASLRSTDGDTDGRDGTASHLRERRRRCPGSAGAGPAGAGVLGRR